MRGIGFMAQVDPFGIVPVSTKTPGIFSVGIGARAIVHQYASS
eukprot:COSAG02_NODE_1788_length_10924_cov_15.455150_1_plen_43_part_00